MRSLTFAIGAAAMLATAAPTAAQVGGYEGLQFLSAVQKRDGSKANQLLADHPTIVDARDSKGDTPLLIAVRRGDYDWTAFLLNKGADPNLGGAGGDTPLIAAARIGFEEGAEWLLNQGAKVDGTNRQGETPLIVAVQMRQQPLVKFLLAHGANPDIVDAAQGFSARDYATRDNRGRQILQMIEAKKPKPGSAAAK